MQSLSRREISPNQVDRTDILRLVTRLNVGGPARHVLLLSRELQEFRTVLAAGKPAPTEGELSDPAVPVVHLPLVRPIRPAIDVRAFLAIRRKILELKPRVLDTHMAKAGTLGRMAAVTTDHLRTVHTFHGHVFQAYFRPAMQESFIRIERWLARRTDILIAVSQEIRDELLDLGIGRSSQFHVVQLGFNIEPFLAAHRSGSFRQRFGIPAEVPLVGVFGRLVPIKDLETLLAAVKPLDGVHLAVVGDGELRGKLEATASILQVDGRVHFTGWYSDVAEAMGDVDVVALTSRNEGTPMSLIEALAAARPVVATAVGGVPSIVDHGETGLLVEPGDVSDISDALRKLLADARLRARMGLAGRERVSNRYQSKRMLSEMRILYEDLLNQPGD